MKDMWSKLLSRVSQLHRSCGRSTSQHERCVTHRRVNKNSQCRYDKTMVKVDNEFKMNWLHEPTWRERPFFTGGLTATVLAGSNTWALCVWCPRAAAPGSTKQKEEKTPLVPRDRSINQTVRNWSRSARRPRGTRSSECSDDCRSQESEVADPATNNSQEETGVMNQETSMAEQDHGARSQGRRERRWSGSPEKQGLTTT